MACDEFGSRYGQVFAGESLKLMKIIGDLKPQGCELVDPKTIGKLQLKCETYAARAKCLEALFPDGEKYCVTPPLKMSDTLAAEQSVPAGAQPSAAALGGRRGTGQTATAGRTARQHATTAGHALSPATTAAARPAQRWADATST